MSARPTALVADDEPALADYLCASLQRLWPELLLLPVARNGIDALAAIRNEEPDVAFLDIRMPGLTGLELAARIDAPTHVVFVTAYDQYAVEAFDRDAVDYILKPVTDDRLMRAIGRLKDKLAARQAPEDLSSVLRRLFHGLPGASTGHLRWIRALKGDEVHQIPVADVVYFQAQDKYTCIFTADGESLIRLPLAELALQLDPEEFCQIHRSTIVNMHAVISARRDLRGRTFVRLRNVADDLPVSRAHAHRFKQM